MPTYEYECVKCGHHFDVMQSFSDAPITRCTECRGKVRRVFSPPAIIFKGSGFHCTDYKKGNGSKPSSAKDFESASKSESACESATAECKGKCAAS